MFDDNTKKQEQELKFSAEDIDLEEDQNDEDQLENKDSVNDHDQEQKLDTTDEHEDLELELEEKDKILSKLEEELTLVEKEKEEYINRLQRLQAEYINYRKRSDKEKGQIQSTVTIEIIRDLLPIIDNFQRALTQANLDNDFSKGVEMIYRQIVNFLKNQGIEEIETIGQEFDHNIHNAIAQIESNEHDSGIIIEEVQKGYILADKVVRPAMVKVVQ